jgi:hypothetical protein
VERQGGRIDLAVDDARRGVFAHARVHRQRRTWVVTMPHCGKA